MKKLAKDLKFYKISLKNKQGEEKLRIWQQIKSVGEETVKELKKRVEKKKTEKENMQKALRMLERMEKEGKIKRVGNKSDLQSGSRIVGIGMTLE
jgi:hypothetical protein